MSNLISARLFVKNCNLLQEAGSVRLHQKLEIEVKTQGFVGPCPFWTEVTLNVLILII